MGIRGKVTPNRREMRTHYLSVITPTVAPRPIRREKWLFILEFGHPKVAAVIRFYREARVGRVGAWTLTLWSCVFTGYLSHACIHIVLCKDCSNAWPLHIFTARRRSYMHQSGEQNIRFLARGLQCILQTLTIYSSLISATRNTP